MVNLPVAMSSKNHDSLPEQPSGASIHARVCLAWSCGGNLGCCELMCAPATPCLTSAPHRAPLPLWGFYILSAPSSTKFLHLGWWEVRDGTSPCVLSVTYTACFDQFSALPTQKLLWPERRAAQVYTHKHKCLASFPAAQAFSKTTADSTIGPVISPVRGFSVSLNPSCYASLISNQQVTGCSYNHHATIASVGISCQHVSIEICSAQH